MDDLNLDISKHNCFTSSLNASDETNNREEVFTHEDIILAKRFLYLVQLRINSRKIDFTRSYIKKRTPEYLTDDFSFVSDSMEETYFDEYLNWSVYLSNHYLLQEVIALPANQQIVLWELFINQQKQCEIANHLNISPPAVHHLKKRALSKLKIGNIPHGIP